ncbi:uncharacterized protein LOC111083262 [Limulus polyphemus]|uniref:Uncharacterized protein LOC111083262 n=1 Tax=Limulus polyphemus TaxID=6850 RepID=A0ABM1RVE2_LIMPO|nr:uncharacterized protein LOC111083262 [Limulus polyphemus]
MDEDKNNMLRSVFLFGLLGLALAASSDTTKEEDDKKPRVSSNQPVYFSSASSGSSTSAKDSKENHQAPSVNQGGHYYYYYPVQEKQQLKDNSYSVSELQPTYVASSSGSSFKPAGTTSFDKSSAQGSSGSEIYQAAADTQDLNPTVYASQFSGSSSGQLGSSGHGSGINQLVTGVFPGNTGNYVGYLPSANSLNYQYPIGSGSYGLGQGSSSYGFGSLLMQVLGLLGLGLLIPTVTSLTGTSAATSRKQEELNVFSGFGKKLEKYYAIYRSAVEDEDCMNRIICELGNAMSDVRGKTTVINVLDQFVPNWMESKMGVFKVAALSREVGKCSKYRCRW